MNVNIKIQLPDKVRYIVESLESNGYESYVVGGCVRDSILGKVPKDWDICTEALPEKIVEIFSEYKVIYTGIQHGTVTVVIENESYEITTFRIDGKYEDCRHPQNVKFVSDIVSDLSRRDFTMNAIAFNPNRGVVDPFGGMLDIKNKVIKTVGEAEKRFREDPLRILRAIRFASTYGFEIDCKNYVIHRRHLLKHISAERIRDELCKTLLGDNLEVIGQYSDVIAEIIPEFKDCICFEQHNPHHLYDVWTHTMKSLDAAKYTDENDIVTKLAVLFHDIAKPLCYIERDGIGHFYGHCHKSAEMTKSIMQRLRFDNGCIRKVCELIEYHDSLTNITLSGVKRIMQKIGQSQILKLCYVVECDGFGQTPESYNFKLMMVENIRGMIYQIICENQCFRLKDLDINGYDLIQIGFVPGKELGKTLDVLLNEVIDGRLKNNKKSLLEFAKTQLRNGNYDK